MEERHLKKLLTLPMMKVEMDQSNFPLPLRNGPAMLIWSGCQIIEVLAKEEERDQSLDICLIMEFAQRS